MLGPAPLDEARVMPGLVLLGFAVIGVCVIREPRARLLMIWCVVCLLMFAWYVPVAAGERFPFPLLVPLLMYASIGIAHVVGSRTRVVAAGFVLASVVAAIATWSADLAARI